MSTKRISIALLLPPALLAGGCIDQAGGNRGDVAGATEPAGANASAVAVGPEEAPPVNMSQTLDRRAAAIREEAMDQAQVVVATRPAPAASGGKVTSPAGLVAGTLGVRRNCLVVVGATGVTTLPIFREGSFGWDPAAGTLRFAGRAYRLGDKLTLPGGNMPKRSPFVADHRAVIDRCGAADVFIVA
ncbi:MAG TPA: hypothetical protein VGB04_13805 [Allosphingosinicella sp.]